MCAVTLCSVILWVFLWLAAKNYICGLFDPIIRCNSIQYTRYKVLMYNMYDNLFSYNVIPTGHGAKLSISIFSDITMIDTTYMKKIPQLLSINKGSSSSEKVCGAGEKGQ